jgi:hypothetical protein
MFAGRHQGEERGATTNLLSDPLRRRIYFLLLADIALIPRYPTTTTQASPLNVKHDDRYTSDSECLREKSADARRAAGDEDDLRGPVGDGM